MAATGESFERIACRLQECEAICALATGGMAEIHLARTRDYNPRLVVVKTLSAASREDEDRVDMFADEVRVASMLRHPNIVRLLSAGFVDHEPYMILEYVDGPSVRDLIANGCKRGIPMELGLAVSIAIAACDALHYAHLLTDRHGECLGLVHRDVSPQNLMVGSDGIVKILDFGVARAAGRRLETTHRCVKGKIAYSAPEYVLGSTPDRRADVFGLGVLLWEIVTNRRLFAAATMAQAVRALLKGVIPPPSTFNPDVPPALDWAILSSLQREADKRLESAAALRDALFLAAQALGGVLSPWEIAQNLATDYPEALDPCRQMSPQLTKEELSSRAVRIREQSQSDAEWLAHSTQDTAIEVDIDAGGLQAPNTEADAELEIPRHLLIEDE